MINLNILERRNIVSQILKNRGNAAVVAGIGNASYDVASIGDCPLNLYLFGVMGGAVMTAFGIAVAQPRRQILVITGDGEMLAGIGSLATVGIEQPKNLSIVVIDNQVYGATGGQLSHTSAGIDLVGIAASSGIRRTALVKDQLGMKSCLSEIYSGMGVYFAVVKVVANSTEKVDVPLDGTLIGRRFRTALTGE